MGDRHPKVGPEVGVWDPVVSPESWHPAAWVREAVLVQPDSESQPHA